MTTYVVTGANNFLTIKAGSTYAVRIVRVEYGGAAAGGISIYKYVGGGTITGGSVIIPEPMREDLVTPASTATAKAAATGVSGTGIPLSAAQLGGFYTTAANPNTDQFSYSSGSWQPPFDLILRAGSSSVFAAFLAGGSGLTTAIYFEELRLQWAV